MFKRCFLIAGAAVCTALVQGCAGITDKSAPAALGTATTPTTPTTPTAPVGALGWNDPRVRWWIRADKTNQDIATKYPTGAQGSVSNCDYDDLVNVPEPNMFDGRVILARKDGYFQHRIWDGMCLWQGQRQRSALHTSDRYQDLSSIKVGRSYWFAFGGKFHPDMFSADGDRAIQILDFHHKSPSSALSGNSPWACYAETSGYSCVLQWNRNDSGITSPSGETGNNGSQLLTIIRDTSRDTTRPHFLAFRFKLSPGADGWVEVYRQIGVDGPIEKVSSYNVPTTYSGSENLLFPKYGLHQWYPRLTGKPTRSIDMAGALLVEDVTVPPEVIFRSLTVAIPR
jgi:hypothetical protein